MSRQQEPILSRPAAGAQLGGPELSACYLRCVRAQGKTVGIIGAGRIGSAYARMMAEGHKCNIVYYDPYPNKKLEGYLADYSK